MEVLGHGIPLAVDSGEWKTVKTSRNGPPLSHLFFADDLFLFGEASASQVQVMADVLQNFWDISGGKANHQKPPHNVSQNTHIGVAADISSRFNIPKIENLGKYHRMPIMHGRVAKCVFEFITSKVRKRLSGWKCKVLSKGARAILIQAVTLLCHEYYKTA